MRASWLGNDLVTLLVAVPVIGIAALLSGRSPRAFLVTLGSLAYALYGYLFYLFGAASNALFLVYVGIVASATLGLIAGLTSRAVHHVIEAAESYGPGKLTGGAVLVVSATLGLFWSVVTATTAIRGTVPEMVARTAHPTNVTGALDLWLVVTFGVLDGTCLVRGRPWGYVVSAIWSVKGALYMAALSAASVTAFRAGAASDLAQLGPWVPLGLACGTVAIGVLRRVPGRFR